MEIGEVVGCRRVRIFSFYPPTTSSNARYDEYVDEAVSRLRQMAELAGSAVSRCCWKTRRASSPTRWRAVRR
jgi:hypothetical protein